MIISIITSIILITSVISDYHYNKYPPKVPPGHHTRYDKKPPAQLPPPGLHGYDTTTLSPKKSEQSDKFERANWARKYWAAEAVEPDEDEYDDDDLRDRDRDRDNDRDDEYELEEVGDDGPDDDDEVDDRDDGDDDTEDDYHDDDEFEEPPAGPVEIGAVPVIDAPPVDIADIDLGDRSTATLLLRSNFNSDDLGDEDTEEGGADIDGGLGPLPDPEVLPDVFDTPGVPPRDDGYHVEDEHYGDGGEHGEDGGYEHDGDSHYEHHEEHGHEHHGEDDGESDYHDDDEEEHYDEEHEHEHHHESHEEHGGDHEHEGDGGYDHEYGDHGDHGGHEYEHEHEGDHGHEHGGYVEEYHEPDIKTTDSLDDWDYKATDSMAESKDYEYIKTTDSYDGLYEYKHGGHGGHGHHSGDEEGDDSHSMSIDDDDLYDSHSKHSHSSEQTISIQHDDSTEDESTETNDDEEDVIDGSLTRDTEELIEKAAALSASSSLFYAKWSFYVLIAILLLNALAITYCIFRQQFGSNIPSSTMSEAMNDIYESDPMISSDPDQHRANGDDPGDVTEEEQV